jgi:hypothetical protein
VRLTEYDIRTVGLTAELSGEVEQVVDEQVWGLDGREVTVARHVRVADDVVAALGPGTGRPRKIGGKHCDCGRRRDPTQPAWDSASVLRSDVPMLL